MTSSILKKSISQPSTKSSEVDKSTAINSNINVSTDLVEISKPQIELSPEIDKSAAINSNINISTDLEDISKSQIEMTASDLYSIDSQLQLSPSILGKLETGVLDKQINIHELKNIDSFSTEGTLEQLFGDPLTGNRNNLVDEVGFGMLDEIGFGNSVHNTQSIEVLANQNSAVNQLGGYESATRQGSSQCEVNTNEGAPKTTTFLKYMGKKIQPRKPPQLLRNAQMLTEIQPQRQPQQQQPHPQPQQENQEIVNTPQLLKAHQQLVIPRRQHPKILNQTIKAHRIIRHLMNLMMKSVKMWRLVCLQLALGKQQLKPPQSAAQQVASMLRQHAVEWL